MIYVAGAGAMADAAKAMRRVQSRINRRARRSKRRARQPRGGGGSAAYEPERTDFPCVFLCMTCGYFVDDPDPDDEGAAPDHACPSCETTSWVDLAVEPTAAMVRDLEEEERHRAPDFIKHWILGACAGLFGLFVALLVGSSYLSTGEWLARTYQGRLIYASVFAIAATAFAYYALPQRLSVWLLKGRERLPDRWHAPLGLPEPDEEPAQTFEQLEAATVDETITAPVSGRDCIAYQVSVLFDVEGDARPPEWVLQEQRATEVDLGGEFTAPPDRLFLESDEEYIRVPGAADLGETPGERYTDIKRFLRQRGLFITDGEFEFYEARLEPGDHVRAERFDEDRELYVVRDASE
jgi:hypothetical protein